MNLEEEVKKGKVDYERWMREKEPKGFRPGTRDFRRNVTVVREEAGAMAAEADKRRLGAEEFERRFAERRARFGGGTEKEAEGRKDSGVASVGNEDSDEEVMVVGEAPPKGILFSMKELERRLEKRVGEGEAQVGRGTPPTRQQMIDWLLSIDEKELARRHSRRREGEADWAEAVVSEGATEAFRTAEAAAAAAATSGGKGSAGGKGKGSGKGASSRREKEAEERHVRRQEDARGK